MENISFYLILETSYKMYRLFILKRKVKTFNFHDEVKQFFLDFECQSELTLLSGEKLIAKNPCFSSLLPQLLFTGVFCDGFNVLGKQGFLEKLCYKLLYTTVINMWYICIMYVTVSKCLISFIFFITDY